MPSPHLKFDKRVLEQDIAYDWLGNTATTDDDAHGFYDRSLGTITNDTAHGKPYQLASANNATRGGHRRGQLETKYDAAGNLTDMAVTRGSASLCLPSGVCNHRFRYDWDEVGRLVRAERWDTLYPDVNDGLPDYAPPNWDLIYAYDASDNRVLKSSAYFEIYEQVWRHSVYASAGQELRGAQFGAAYLDPDATGTADYEINAKTEIAYLFAHGVRLGRVAYDNGAGMPEFGENAPNPAQHVLINLDDTLGSTAIVIDKATSELVEASSYLAHGATESDYRPDRWKGLREDYRFTGKEEDVEVGLQYFGKRFLSPYLNRWVSADPLAVHSPGQGDLNVYAYVQGKVLRALDPVGLDLKDSIHEVQWYLSFNRLGGGNAQDAKNLTTILKFWEPLAINLPVRVEGWGRLANLLKTAQVAASIILKAHELNHAVSRTQAFLDNNPRVKAVMSALTDDNRETVDASELPGIAYTVHRVESMGYQLKGSIKTIGNQGIDLEFVGIGKNRGRSALAEAKSGPLDMCGGTLTKDTRGFTQGSREWFRDRLTQAGRTDLLKADREGKVDFFIGFAGGGDPSKAALVDSQDAIPIESRAKEK